MSLTKTSHFSPLSHFLPSGKPLPDKKFDFISKCFDENLLKRLKPLLYHPSIDLSWLSFAVDILSSTHADAETLISNLKSSPGSEDSLKKYLDDSVKVLSICNSITSEIDRLMKSRLSINFALHLLDFSGEGVPSTEKLRRSRNSLHDCEKPTPTPKNLNRKVNLENPATLIRELATGLGSPPRGKITTVGKLVERTTYAVGVLTVFITSVAVASLTESGDAIPIRVSSEFLWADAFNGIESAISKEMGENGGLIGELDEVDARVKVICRLIDEKEGDRERLVKAVKELSTEAETFSDGLDRLYYGVDGFFHTVLRTRSNLLQNFRLGSEKSRTKLCK